MLCGLFLGSAGPCGAQGLERSGSAFTLAQAAARSWFGLVDAAQYEASWDSAAAVFRTVIARPDWQGSLLKERAPLGRVLRRGLLRATYQTRLPGAPPGEYVVLRYEAELWGKRKLVETVTPMREPDGHWRVAGYYIRPQ